MNIAGRTLITGGSGFIGSHFHSVLPNDSLVNLDLVPPKFSCQSQYVAGNIRDLEKVRATLLEFPCNRIVHLAAEHKDFGINRDAYFLTNEFGTQNLCQAATEFGIKEIVFYSSVAVYGANTTPSTEAMTPQPNSHYGESKLKGEAALRNWAAEDLSRRVIIIRPAVVYGERNIANMFRLISQIKSGRYFHVGAANNIKSIAYVKNLVDATLWLMNRHSSGVVTYNYSDLPQLSSREIADHIAKKLNRRAPMTLPYWILYLLALPFDLAIAITGRDLAISTKRVTKLCTETFHRADRIVEAGFKPKFTNLDGLSNMIQWMQSDQFASEAIFDV